MDRRVYIFLFILLIIGSGSLFLANRHQAAEVHEIIQSDDGVIDANSDAGLDAYWLYKGKQVSTITQYSFFANGIQVDAIGGKIYYNISGSGYSSLDVYIVIYAEVHVNLNLIKNKTISEKHFSTTNGDLSFNYALSDLIEHPVENTEYGISIIAKINVDASNNNGQHAYAKSKLTMAASITWQSDNPKSTIPNPENETSTNTNTNPLPVVHITDFHSSGPTYSIFGGSGKFMLLGVVILVIIVILIKFKLR